MSEQCKCGSLLCGNIRCKLQAALRNHCELCGSPYAGNGICINIANHSKVSDDQTRLERIRHEAKLALENTPSSKIAQEIMWLTDELRLSWENEGMLWV